MVSVNVTLLPTLGVPLLTSLVIAMSATATGVVPALDELLFGFGSGVVDVVVAVLR